jgi:ribonuclease HII
MPDLSFETLHGRNSGKVICGVDEVGRGPLAGPVVAAAVILPQQLSDDLRHGIRDSKKLSPTRRETLFALITQSCHYSIAEATVEEIFELNILWASMLAMRRAVDALESNIDMALIDGNYRPPNFRWPSEPIIKGDDKSLSIAAASIIAKVTRDRIMKNLAKSHPGYGWERNAGYGTTEHLAALTLLGPTAWHRASFAPIAGLNRLSN